MYSTSCIANLLISCANWQISKQGHSFMNLIMTIPIFSEQVTTHKCSITHSDTIILQCIQRCALITVPKDYLYSKVIGSIFRKTHGFTVLTRYIEKKVSL